MHVAQRHVCRIGFRPALMLVPNDMPKSGRKGERTRESETGIGERVGDGETDMSIKQFGSKKP